MTLSCTPAGSITHEKTIVFSDFITGLDQWGWVNSNAPAALLSVSNTSSNALGIATIGTPANSTGLWGRSGIYLSRDGAGLAAVNREYLSSNSPMQKLNVFEARVKSNVDSEFVHSYAGLGLAHNGKILYDGRITRLDKGIAFHAWGNEPYWTATIWCEEVPYFEFTTKLKKNEWNTLRVEWRWLDLLRTEVAVTFYGNGSVVAEFKAKTLGDFITALHSVEVRDKTGTLPTTGCGNANQTINVDYMYAEIPSYRDAARP